MRLPSALGTQGKGGSASQDFEEVVEPWKRRLSRSEVLGEDFLYGDFWFLLALTSTLSCLGT